MLQLNQHSRQTTNENGMKIDTIALLKIITTRKKLNKAWKNALVLPTHLKFKTDCYEFYRRLLEALWNRNLQLNTMLNVAT